MAEDNPAVFGGSVDRSKLEEMKAAAGDDPDRQRIVDEVQAQVDAVAESDAAAEDARQRAAGETERADDQSAEQPAQEQPPAEPADHETAPVQPEDLSALNKPELVDRANAAGIDTAGKSKAELVQELEAQRGDDYVP